MNTKLDTKLPQYGMLNDVAEFIMVQIVERLSTHKLGGPIYECAQWTYYEVGVGREGWQEL